VPGAAAEPYPGEVLQGSRSGVGLVPVAVNDYSPPKGRCGSGASEVQRHRAGGDPPAVGYCVGPSCHSPGGQPPGLCQNSDKVHPINTRAAKAKKNQACGRGGVLLLQNSVKAFAPIDTRAEIAKIAGCPTTLSPGCMSRAAAPFPLGSEQTLLENSPKALHGSGRCSGGVRVSPGRRSSGYGLLCGPLLPFLREGGPGAGFAEFSKGRGGPPRACRCGVPKWTFGEFSKKCLLARAGVGNQVQLVRILTTLLSELKRFRRILQKHFVNIPRA